MAPSHPSLGDPGDVVEYYPQNPLSAVDGLAAEKDCQPLTVHVPNADIRSIFAHRQWRAGMLMADLIYAGILPLKGRIVLELGAGTGLPSMIAGLNGQADAIICTDYDSPSLISTLKLNVSTNIRDKDGSSIKVSGHTWGTAIEDVSDLVPQSSFDVILLADCIWDELSHPSLIKSIISLLGKGTESRVYMVSGLHTGRDKIISFIRRAHRAGLQLVPFPQDANNTWPSLSESEKEIGEAGQWSSSSDEEALKSATRYIVEMQLQFDDSEEVTAPSSDGKVKVWQAKTPRLSKKRRPFVLEERPEETKENDGVHIRNTWITFLALSWVQ